MQERVRKPGDRLVRKQVLISPEQNASLKRLAASTRCSEGALVRAAVEEFLTLKAAETVDWKSAWMEIAGMWADYPEIEQIMTDARERRRQRRDRINRRMRGEEL